MMETLSTPQVELVAILQRLRGLKEQKVKLSQQMKETDRNINQLVSKMEELSDKIFTELPTKVEHNV